MLEPTREWDSSGSERDAAQASRAQGRAPFDLALEHVREVSDACNAGHAALADLEEAVADLALVARSSGMLPEALIIALKQTCSSLFASREQSVGLADDLRSRLVNRAIEAYFGE